MKSNFLSMFGRMGYSSVWLIYPAGAAYYALVHKKNKEAEVTQIKQDTLDGLSKAKVVDPDLFNPFSTIPFHNNVEMKYIYADTKMHGYIDKEQQNVKDYYYKGYHDSYDHSGNREHLYNWTSVGVQH